MHTYTIEGIQKKVIVVSRHNDATGRIYLPGEWTGEEVEVVRTGRVIVDQRFA